MNSKFFARGVIWSSIVAGLQTDVDHADCLEARACALNQLQDA